MAARRVSSSRVRAAVHARAMDENVIVTTFSEDSKAYEALARLEELAAHDQIDLHDGAVVERAQDGTLHLRDEAGNETAVIAGAEEAAREARVKARKELRHQRREAT